MKPKISIIIPIYNSEKTLERTFKSLKNQTFKNFEIIAINDNSQDKSLEIAKKYTKNIIIHKINKGPAVSRNEGIKKAKADLLAFIDSDCAATKNWLMDINNKFKDNSIQVVMGATRIPPSTFLANSIASLGFPGGANAGFEKVWHVNSE